MPWISKRSQVCAGGARKICTAARRASGLACSGSIKRAQMFRSNLEVPELACDLFEVKLWSHVTCTGEFCPCIEPPIRSRASNMDLAYKNCRQALEILAVVMWEQSREMILVHVESKAQHHRGFLGRGASVIPLKFDDQAPAGAHGLRKLAFGP